ncbi:MAG: nitrate reductase molybdenum cofactor assembly chaperone [Anaerolineae bacterium]|nr:nitrate reductase molybdenum cofactor assembly chaperone [Anaerolineae bacterium]
MAATASTRRIFNLFADILEYPRPGLAETARACAALLAEANAEAVALLGEFAAFVAATPPGRLEEIYTAAFDLDATYYPYVSYHLLGESYTRSAFIVELKARYQVQGFDVENELPDHLVVILRFLAGCDDAALAAELIDDALRPALARMVGQEAAEDANPYRAVLQALHLALEPQAAGVVGVRQMQGARDHA